ncbi:lanthionine synthetase C family protein [Brevibacillus ruminantium]|uniref:Lanthionine synthetase C family protein n=1 Tax=Brevibacillus ruminantium TaxID=2950604 RepID=A0ABY4WCK3_9BACL|nr:lanthionine synthetase C family protein [Brevibacillus ruminantium]USG63893.1 lanthionine synthetase C family protein [Brevibacillus ruminantium]
MQVKQTKSQWKPVSSPQMREMIEKQVFEIAARLQDAAYTAKIAENAENRFESMGAQHALFHPASLASGYTGISLLYAELDKNDPNYGWDVKGHTLLTAVQQEVQRTGIHGLGLWTGLSGICFAVHLLSRQGTRYQVFLQKLEEQLGKRLPEYLAGAKARLQDRPAMSDYDVINGVAGIGRYLLLRQDQPELVKLLYDVIAYLVALAGERKVAGKSVPAWHISKEKQATIADAERFPQGNFNCGVSHGIPGVLSLLSLALQHGVEIEGQREAIQRIAEWLLAWKQTDAYGDLWAPQLSLENWEMGKVDPFVHREAWCYGTPGVARALWLAGESLGQADWKQAALKAYRGTFRRPQELWNLYAPTICHGYAGLLLMTQRMYAESGELRAERDRLAEQVITMFSSEAPFGYYEVQRLASGDRRLHYPGLLDGAAGTALVLLSLLRAEPPEWEAALLLS